MILYRLILASPILFFIRIVDFWTCLVIAWFIFVCRYWVPYEEGYINLCCVPNYLSLFLRCQHSFAFLNNDFHLLLLWHVWYAVSAGFVNLESFFLCSILYLLIWIRKKG